MNDGTSENSPKKRGRPPKIKDDIALGAITDEDLELERRLNSIDANTPVEAMVSDVAPETKITKEKSDLTLLNEVMDDVKVPKTLSELRDVVFEAKAHGANCIEASPEIMKYHLKTSYPPEAGYFMYDSVRIYEVGTFDQFKDDDKLTVEQRVFGKK